MKIIIIVGIILIAIVVIFFAFNNGDINLVVNKEVKNQDTKPAESLDPSKDLSEFSVIKTAKDSEIKTDKDQESSIISHQGIINPKEESFVFPLSYQQEALWFLHQLEPGLIAYNLPICYLVRGNLKLPILKKALNKVVARHEALRTSFKEENGAVFQVIHNKVNLKIRGHHVLQF